MALICIASKSSCQISYQYISDSIAATLEPVNEDYNVIISLHKQYPTEATFAKFYLDLTNKTVNLFDSLLNGFLRNGMNESPFKYFSKDENGEKLFLMLKDIYSHGSTKLSDPHKGVLNEKLINVASSKNSNDWVKKTFKDKQMIDALAIIREHQTNCLIISDLVFEDMKKQIEQNGIYDSLAMEIIEMMKVHYQFSEGQVKINNQTTESYSWIHVSTDSFTVEVMENFDKVYITLFYLNQSNKLPPYSHVKLYKHEPIKRKIPSEKIFGVLFECFYKEHKKTFLRLMKNTKVE
jgi:hypothetical protein